MPNLYVKIEAQFFSTQITDFRQSVNLSDNNGTVGSHDAWRTNLFFAHLPDVNIQHEVAAQSRRATRPRKFRGRVR